MAGAAMAGIGVSSRAFEGTQLQKVPTRKRGENPAASLGAMGTGIVNSGVKSGVTRMTSVRSGLAFWFAFIWYQGAYAQEQAPDPVSALPWLKLEQLSATRERPLFTPGRHRPEPPRPPDTPAASVTIEERTKSPEIELTGLIQETDVTIVFLRTDSETVILRSGDKFGRWLVVADSKTSVKLTDGAEQMRLSMFKEP
jgi:hypothetical protein